MGGELRVIRDWQKFRVTLYDTGYKKHFTTSLASEVALCPTGVAQIPPRRLGLEYARHCGYSGL